MGFDEIDITKHIINHDNSNIPLPATIRLKDPVPGEIPIWKKRTYPKAMRIHKKREDTDPHRFFLSELLLYTPYTDEKQLGSNDEKLCRQLYLQKQEQINHAKQYLLPFAQGVEEARFYVRSNEK